MKRLIELLDHVAEKLDEAVSDKSNQKGAIAEAAGALPELRELMDDHLVTVSMLVCEPLVDGNAEAWWESFGKMDREPFLEQAYKLRSGVCQLRKAIEQKGSPA
jgi:hypothetical protein